MSPALVRFVTHPAVRATAIEIATVVATAVLKRYPRPGKA